MTALFDEVTRHLATRHIRYAVIGAAALALHGVSRSTFDQDLLVTDSSVLAAEMWEPLRNSTAIDVRRGDAGDPLAGVVRFQRADERPVDIVVGRFKWQSDIVLRAERLGAPGAEIPLARAADLVLLKLYAGGSQDRWDIEQLLALDLDGAIRTEVESRISDLPGRCETMWAALRHAS